MLKVLDEEGEKVVEIIDLDASLTDEQIWEKMEEEIDNEEYMEALCEIPFLGWRADSSPVEEVASAEADEVMTLSEWCEELSDWAASATSDYDD